MNAEHSEILLDNDSPELTDEQLKIMSLVLSHKGTRGGSRKALYIRGREEERVNALRNLMDSMSMSLQQAMTALKIPSSEYKKYAAII